MGTALVGDSTRGAEAIDFAENVLGITLLPWQKWLLDAALRTDDTGRWMTRTMCCIVARQQGKSTVTACRILAGLCLWGERMIIGAAQSRDVSLECWRVTVAMAEEADLPIKKVFRGSGREELVLEIDDTPRRYKVVTASPQGARGLSVDVVVLDEVRAYRSFDVWSALDKTRRARPSSQVWGISTEGDITSVVLANLQEQGRAAVASGVPGPVAYFEWSADPTFDPGDPRGWAQANPALGYLLDLETIAAEHATDPPSVFAQEVLCWRTEAAGRPWLPDGLWDGTADPAATVPDDADGEVTFALDASPDLRRLAIAVSWPRRQDDRTHLELIATHTSPREAEAHLLALVPRWQPRALAVLGKGPAEPIAARVAAAAGVDLETVNATDFDRGVRRLYEAVSSQRIVHPPDPVLAAHVEAAQAARPGLFTLTGPADVTGAVAAVLTYWTASKTPAEPKFKWALY
jgi:hypothetical protein